MTAVIFSCCIKGDRSRDVLNSPHVVCWLQGNVIANEFEGVPGLVLEHSVRSLVTLGCQDTAHYEGRCGPKVELFETGTKFTLTQFRNLFLFIECQCRLRSIDLGVPCFPSCSGNSSSLSAHVSISHILAEKRLFKLQLDFDWWWRTVSIVWVYLLCGATHWVTEDTGEFPAHGLGALN